MFVNVKKVYRVDWGWNKSACEKLYVAYILTWFKYRGYLKIKMKSLTVNIVWIYLDPKNKSVPFFSGEKQ